jgi:hypothetical protein
LVFIKAGRGFIHQDKQFVQPLCFFVLPWPIFDAEALPTNLLNFKNTKMKNMILSSALLFSVAVHSAVAGVYPGNEKVVKTFNEVFKNARNIIWSNTAHLYNVSFSIASVRASAILDNKGNLLQTVRYYNEDRLPATILYAIRKDYPRKDIFGVTEVSNKHGIIYRIVLKDEKSYMYIHANSYGESEVISKYKRGDK